MRTPQEALGVIVKALNENNTSIIDEVIAEDIVYEIYGNEGISGIYRGRDAFINMMKSVIEMTENTMKADPRVVMSDGKDLMMWVAFTGSRPDGRTYESHHAYLYRFRDGQLYEGHTIPTEPDKFDRFMND